MTKARVDEADVLEAARLHRGLERMEDIKYALLETNGAISIIPQPFAPGTGAAARLGPSAGDDDSRVDAGRGGS
jgi:uncharacterized membrane protein YcaP (DUF421 family)